VQNLINSNAKAPCRFQKDASSRLLSSNLAGNNDVLECISDTQMQKDVV
jgi:hypothetical protein